MLDFVPAGMHKVYFLAIPAVEIHLAGPGIGGV